MDYTKRPQVEGTFLKVDEKRFYVKGTTYGTFAPDAEGFQFPDLEIIDDDFRLMTQAGINTVRTYTVPSTEILDLALLHDLKVMIGLPWEQHMTFLDSRKQQNQIIENVKKAVLSCNQHQAILCYTIGNEIPSRIVRWHGMKKITRFLHRLYKTVKDADPEGLVTYVNYPTTEYLHLPFLDFDSFNVYLEEKETLVKYLARLHNLCGDKPLVLAEIGLDSLRNGEDKQAEVLDWQIRTIFERGCAGAFVFAWTDEWWRGGAEIKDWDFGLVDRQRNPKPALKVIQKVFEDVPFATDRRLPKFSVVVCSYNGSKTIRDTMDGLMRLDYPDYEVIVVNDGSTDHTAEIVREYDVRMISTENMGLSSARNTGLQESTGEIVAYIDDDAYPDPQWLKYLAVAYMNSDHAGIGGPNINPGNDGPIADCVANSPGRPLHVLTSDEIAEHIPGCNMSFRRDVLLEIKGFDPIYRAAGDDVDLCWRVQHAGYTIGFHPSAFVWHHSRNSVRTYWKQQQGYGKAEALLEKKWPERYNVLGHLSWAGRIYGNGLTLPLINKRKRIFYGSQGTALFQSIYQPANGYYSVLPLMPEWHYMLAILAIISLLGMEWNVLLWAIPILFLSLTVIVLQAAISAKKAFFASRPKSKRQKLKLYTLTTALHLLQPIARLKGRIKHGLNPLFISLNQIKHVRAVFSHSKLKHWSEEWKSPEDWLEEIHRNLLSLNNKVVKGDDYDHWDFTSRTGLTASVRSLMTIEEHGMGKQYIKVKTWKRISVFGLFLLAVFALLFVFALKAGALISAVFMGILGIMHGIKILSDLAGGMYSMDQAIKLLPEGIPEMKIEVAKQRIPVNNVEKKILNKQVKYLHIDLYRNGHKKS